MGKIKNVFIVDDSQVVLKTNAALFRGRDFNVKTFSNPNEALEQMTINPPEIILLDYFMPEMNGSTFMVKVSERLLNNHDWQVFLVTSHEFSEEEKASMLTLGITHIFEKPLKKADLDKALAAFEA